MIQKINNTYLVFYLLLQFIYLLLTYLFDKATRQSCQGLSVVLATVLLVKIQYFFWVMWTRKNYQKKACPLSRYLYPQTISKQTHTYTHTCIHQTGCTLQKFFCRPHNDLGTGQTDHYIISYHGDIKLSLLHPDLIRAGSH